MDCFSKLVALAVLATAGTVHAGYAQLAPPAGFSGTPGAWTFAPAANDLRYGATAYSPNALRVPVPGTSVTMPAAFRFAANAPRIAAAVIFMNPYVRAGVGIATWLGVAKIVWDAADGVWRQKGEYVTGLEYGTYYQGQNHWFPSPEAACAAWKSGMGITVGSAKVQGSTCSVTYINPQGVEYPQGSTSINTRTGNGYCPAPFIQTPAGCVSPALTQPDFVEKLNPANQPGWPMPDTVPWELPRPTPLPVEQPVINPEPVPNPVPRPLFVPTGDPVPNPQYDPNAAPGPNNQPWIQPGVRVNPSPTPSEPWRVDLQPVNRPVPGPEPMPAPDSNNPPNPDKPREEQIDFCVKNPDVLACQKLDEPNSEELPASEKPISISPDGGWGADNASCPAPKQITVQGRAIPIPFDLFCTWATGMRPIIIAMAWLSAAFILLGARNES